MSRSVIVHAVLLACSLIAAYLIWVREPSTEKEETTPIVSFRSLDRAVYSADKLKVELSQRNDAVGEYAWVEIARQKVETPPRKAASKVEKAPKTPPAEAPTGKTPADAKATDKAKEPAPAQPAVKEPEAPKPRTVTKVVRFKGNDGADRLLESLARLPAVRALGQLGKDKLEEFGLTKSKKTLALFAGSAKREFVVGNRTYGNQDYYLKDQRDGRVYVVRQRAIDDLSGAEQRLIDRKLHGFPLSDVERATISSKAKGGDETRTLLQRNRLKPKSAYWTKEGDDAGQRKDRYRNWMTKLWRLRAINYAEPSGALKPLFKIEYFGRGKRIGTMELLEDPTLAANTVAAAPQGASNYFAKTENTRAPVKLSKVMAEEIQRDLDTILKD